jgi:hypothetical protein
MRTATLRSPFVVAIVALVVTGVASAFAAPKPEPKPQPELIGEGTISTDQDEFGAMPDKDWTTIYFDRSIPAHYHYIMYESSFVKGKWTTPEVLPFSGQYRDSDPVISVDGSTLYFVSDRPAPGKQPQRFHAWAVKRTGHDWGKPYVLAGPVNEDGNTEFISFASNGNLYFTSDRKGTSFDVFRSRLVEGKYQAAEDLGPEINDGRYTIEAFVAPDESYILLGSFAEGFGNSDLFVSYNNKGHWSKPVNLGGVVNSRARDYSPRISPDGKYLVYATEKGFPIEKHDQPVTYDEFTTRLHGTLNGLGNIYRIPLDYVLENAKQPQ